MAAFDPEKITFFAKTDARGQDLPFGIKAKDRQRHMYVVGKTGMGKSTLLENMAAQDIQTGEGMAFIDPHGSAAETLLEYVPEHRVQDVIYFAPFDLNHPISFNVMEDVGPDKRHLVVSGLMSTFKKIWVDAWSARMEYILTNALLVLIEYPDTTLLSVNRLFIDKEFRTRVVDYCKDPAVKSFWTEEFANYTDRFAAEALPAIQNKIGQFTGNPLIRNIIGQPHSSFDIRKIMDEKKILIMNLSKGLIGETNANLLGSMLTTRIYLAAMSRADLPVDVMRTMPNFYFYVDEFQSFANSTFANILSEARKYHLNLIIAHQYIAQMEEEVRDAVFGNVGTTIAFRVGPFDGEVLETVFSPRFLATDLVNLGFAQIYLTLMIDGIGSQPFSAQTLPPVTRPHISCRDMVLATSRTLYAKDRVSVEQVVSDLHTPVPSQKSSSDRRNTGPSQGGRSVDGKNDRGPVVRPESRPETPPSAPAAVPSSREAAAAPAPAAPTDTRTNTPAHERSTDTPTPPIHEASASVSTPARALEPTVPSSRAERPARVPDERRSSTSSNASSRPTPTAKAGQSLEELRAVLAKISQQTGETKKPDNSVNTKKTPTPRTVPAPGQTNTVSPTPTVPEPVRPAPGRERPVPTPSPTNQSVKRPEVKTPPRPAASNLQSALAAAIASAASTSATPDSKPDNAEAAAVTPAPVSTRSPSAPSLAPRPAPPDTRVSLPVEVAAVSDAAVVRADMQRMADEAEAIFATLEHNTTLPLAVAPKAVDTDRVKQIFREATGRSPF